ncbi:MAG: sigma-54-dependent Fis family transcriptional regulator [Deltaproteobacteria bacterium]|nr:sigma-54-dependent Fis family transcriptional regulator [Deltaproteobacteria bacterium]
MGNVLVIDDNDTLREGAVAVCERMGHRVIAASSGDEGLKRLDKATIDLVLTDLKMSGLDGMGVLRGVKERDTNIAVILMTAYGSIENAVEAMKLGAFDYIEKPFSPDVLRVKVERALAWHALRDDNTRLKAFADALCNPDGRAMSDGEAALAQIVGESAAILDLKHRIRKVGPTDTEVHVFGASGTGKELVARAVHALSKRASGPLVTVNCGAIPETLIESELFGHEKGAFTGAQRRKLGRFELANGGTIFLDEVGELSLAMQVKLLRVLQEREVDRVGSERPVPIDVRVISATNKNLSDEVASGRFREDLFYRLHVVPLQVLPLKERTDDILPLARYFLEKRQRRINPGVIKLSAEAARHLVAYHYPGNVRELENIVEQALVFATPPEIVASDLPQQVAGFTPANNIFQIPVGQQSLNDFLETAERQMILSAYEGCGGVKTETARKLGIKTSALYYKLEKYGIGTVTKRSPNDPRDPHDAHDARDSDDPLDESFESETLDDHTSQRSESDSQSSEAH